MKYPILNCFNFEMKDLSLTRLAAGIVFLVTVVSCSDRDSFLLNEYQKSFEDVIGNKISLIDFDNVQNFDYKVVVLLNTQCASCSLTIKRWSQSVNMKIFKNKHLILLSYGKPNKYFNATLEEFTTGLKSINHIHDKSGRFIYDNNLELYSLDVFLLNEDNEVLLVGDPTKDPLVEKFYKRF